MLASWKPVSDVNYSSVAILLPKAKFDCPSLELPVLNRQVLIGKEHEPYSGGQEPGEKVDSCPQTNSKVFAWSRDS